MIIFFKKILDSLKFVYAVKHILKINKKLVLVKIFFLRIIFSYPFFRNKIKSKQNKNIDLYKFLKGEKISSEKVIEELDNNGLSKTYNIKENYLDKIKNEIPSLIEKISLTRRKKSKLNTDNLYCKNLNDFVVFSKKQSISHIKFNLNLKQNSTLRDIILSECFINLAKDFLNTNEFVVNAVCYISNPINKELDESEKSDNAQLFHFDIDYSKLFKVFIYLSEVTEFDGPHVFIPGSNKFKKIQHTLIKRYDDNEIINNYKKMKKIVGPAGTIFFEDTYGFHKGDTPVKNSRIAIIVEYGKNIIKYDKNFININRENLVLN